MDKRVIIMVTTAQAYGDSAGHVLRVDVALRDMV